MKKRVYDKILSTKQWRKSDESPSPKKNRLLITVNILGSPGPIRFVVNEEDSVSGTIDTAVKLYAREGRLPVLGSDVKSFLLYPANAGPDALNLNECIKACGMRNFVMCKNQRQP